MTLWRVKYGSAGSYTDTSLRIDVISSGLTAR
jgi:hypothetical protein